MSENWLTERSWTEGAGICLDATGLWTRLPKGENFEDLVAQMTRLCRSKSGTVEHVTASRSGGEKWKSKQGREISLLEWEGPVFYASTSFGTAGEPCQYGLLRSAFRFLAR
jgi:hypothetical protein